MFNKNMLKKIFQRFQCGGGGKHTAAATIADSAECNGAGGDGGGGLNDDDPSSPIHPLERKYSQFQHDAATHDRREKMFKRRKERTPEQQQCGDDSSSDTDESGRSRVFFLRRFSNDTKTKNLAEHSLIQVLPAPLPSAGAGDGGGEEDNFMEQISKQCTITTFFNLHPHPTMVTDLHGNIQYANGAMESTFHQSCQTWIGKNILDCDGFIAGKYLEPIEHFFNHMGGMVTESCVKLRCTVFHRPDSQHKCWVEMLLMHPRGQRFVVISMRVVQIEHNLNQMLDKLRREYRYLRNNILSKVFPPFVLSRIEQGETDFLINHHDIIVGAMDIQNYTMECALDNASFSILRPLYFEADRLCELHNICLIEIIGDAFIVAGNCTSMNRNRVEDVIDFFLDFIDYCQSTTSLNVRCGIAMGRAVSGMIGYNQFRYHIFGTTVNLAARMEAQATVNSVRVSPHVREAIQAPEEYSIHSEPKTMVKGLGEMHSYTINRKLVSEDITTLLANEPSPISRHRRISSMPGFITMNSPSLHSIVGSPRDILPMISLQNPEKENKDVSDTAVTVPADVIGRRRSTPCNLQVPPSTPHHQPTRILQRHQLLELQSMDYYHSTLSSAAEDDDDGESRG